MEVMGEGIGLGEGSEGKRVSYVVLKWGEEEVEEEMEKEEEEVWYKWW